MTSKSIKIPSISESAHHKLLVACYNTKGIETNILFQIKNKNQAHLILNRPQRMNAFTTDMYFTLGEYIKRANEIEQVKYIIISGNGGNFSSGNDLASNQIDGLQDSRMHALAKLGLLQNFAMSFIQSKKPIFAIIEGKCIGFVFAMLPLIDRVFATEDSFFTSPLVRLGLCSEIGSSYTFPNIFGQTLAENIIISGTQVTPQTLEKYRLLKCCKNRLQAEKDLNSHLQQLDELDWKSYLAARQLMRANLNVNAEKAMKEQLKILVNRWADPQIPNLVRKQILRQKSLKNKARPKL